MTHSDDERQEPRVTAEYKTEYMGHTYWALYSGTKQVARAYPETTPERGAQDFRAYLTKGDTTEGMAYIGRFATLGSAKSAVVGCMEYVIWPS